MCIISSRVSRIIVLLSETLVAESGPKHIEDYPLRAARFGAFDKCECLISMNREKSDHDVSSHNPWQTENIPRNAGNNDTITLDQYLACVLWSGFGTNSNMEMVYGSG